MLRLGVLRVCVLFCVFVPICHGALKPDMCTLSTAFFL